MKTNLFKFKKLKKEKIVIEEEKTDGPFLLFINKYGKYIIGIILLLLLLLIIYGLYLNFKNMKSSTTIVTNLSDVSVNFDESYEINTINMQPLTGKQAKKEFYERYGNIGLTEGAILITKEVDSANGKITFYSDGSAKIIYSNGSIVRIASYNDAYGINESGEIFTGVKTKKISITKEITLSDNSKVIYYSDNSCEVIVPNSKSSMLVRNSDRVNINNNRFIDVSPSGISKILNTTTNNGYKLTYYEDGTIKVENDNYIYVVRNSSDIDLNNISFPNNNAAYIVNTIDLTDGNKIIYYSDGSAEIIYSNDSIMVRSSKDIVYTSDNIVEIVETKYVSESSKNVTNNATVIYLDNGGALIKYFNGNNEYVYENSDIKYNINNNITNSNGVNSIDDFVNSQNKEIIDLSNEYSIIIDDNGYLIVESSKIVYDELKNIIKTIDYDDVLDDTLDSVSSNHFVIQNNCNDKVDFIIAIEVSSDYNLYAEKELPTSYLKYNVVVDSTYLENQIISKEIPIGTLLEGDVTIDNRTCILYEGSLDAGKDADVNLGIWLDYANLPNDFQNSVFVGTIKVYSKTVEE